MISGKKKKHRKTVLLSSYSIQTRRFIGQSCALRYYSPSSSSSFFLCVLRMTTTTPTRVTMTQAIAI